MPALDARRNVNIRSCFAGRKSHQSPLLCRRSGFVLMGNSVTAEYHSLPTTPNGHSDQYWRFGPGRHRSLIWIGGCQMSIPCKSERSVLSQGELEMVLGTHHPAIYALDGNELRALRVRLREQRSKTRTLARQKQREIRGKAERRGKSFPGTAEQPLRRKQVFANALKRVNKEINRLRKFEACTAHVE